MTIRPTLLALAGLLCCPSVAASGYSGPPPDNFVNRYAPDFAMARYQNGELGVILPGYERVYLYGAWRAIVLGPQALKTVPNPADALKYAATSFNQGWFDYQESEKIGAQWQAAIGAALKTAPAAPSADAAFLNCPKAGYQFAAQTLKELSQRADANAQRLRDWVGAQQLVFRACGDDERPKEQRTKPVAPAELAASEALAWRQMRQYQIAAATFYLGDFAQSAQRFATIGATAGHPLRAWGDYLALRSHIRATLAADAQPSVGDVPAHERWRAAQLAQLTAQARAIWQDPQLAALHEAAHAAVRSLQYKLTPAARLDELSRALDDLHGNPYVDDQVGDWRRLLNERFDSGGLQDAQVKPLETALRAQFGYLDWILTLQHCGYGSDEGPDPACPQERAAALVKWTLHAHAAGHDGLARAWLVAAISLAETLPPALEQAALKVAPDAPEYLTVRYHLVRLYRIAGAADQARRLADAALASASLKQLGSDSARNLLRQERFSAASSRADAANYLLRLPFGAPDADSGEPPTPPLPAEARRPVPDNDGLRWLNSGLAVADLLALAADPQFDRPQRSAIALAAWMRADLLAQADVALRAAQLVAQTAPALAPLAQRYRALDVAERHHLLLVEALRHGWSPVIGAGTQYTTPDLTARARDEELADLWCSIPVDAGAAAAAKLDASAAPGARDAEIQALKALHSATGYIGAHALARVQAHPDDPDLPWLLHVVVQSTRGGCLDPDHSALSKAAFSVLQKRYKGSEWARKTPYFY